MIIWLPMRFPATIIDAIWLENKARFVLSEMRDCKINCSSFFDG